MFEQFDPKKESKDRRHLGAWLLVSSVVYLGIAGGLVAASAGARRAVKEEDLVQVEFAPPPEPEPEPEPEPMQPQPQPEPEPAPPPVATPPSPRPRAHRKALAPPKQVPQEKPPESDKAAVEAGAPGTGQDGFTAAVASGTGSAAAPPPPPPPPRPVVATPKATGPVHLPENATPPVAKSDNLAPAYPEQARKSGVQAVVIAKIVVNSEGRVTSVEILRGPEIFHAPVTAALMTWRYEPARLPDGTAFSTFRIVQLPFKLENL